MTDGNDILEDSQWGWVPDASLKIPVSSRHPELINGLVYFSGEASWTRVKGEGEKVSYFFEHARDLLEVCDGPHRKLSTYEGFLFAQGLTSPPEEDSDWARAGESEVDCAIQN
jgi:hypothetical protein